MPFGCKSLTTRVISKKSTTNASSYRAVRLHCISGILSHREGGSDEKKKECAVEEGGGGVYVPHVQSISQYVYGVVAIRLYRMAADEKSAYTP